MTASPQLYLMLVGLKAAGNYDVVRIHISLNS